MSTLLTPVLYIHHGLRLALYNEAVWWLLFFFFAINRHNFYWHVTFYSFCGTRLYVKAISSFTCPRGPFLLIWWLLFRYLIPLGLVVWCASLTPIHLVTYSPMDAWTRYADHEPHEPYEVLYDTGRNIEAELKIPVVMQISIADCIQCLRSSWTWVQSCKRLDLSQYEWHFCPVAEGPASTSWRIRRHQGNDVKSPNTMGLAHSCNDIRRPRSQAAWWCGRYSQGKFIVWLLLSIKNCISNLL